MADTVYFGQFPTTILLQSSTTFNGEANTGTLTLTPGMYTFAPAAGGGLYSFHYNTIIVKQIEFGVSGGTLGTLTVTKVLSASNDGGTPIMSVVVATLNTSTPTYTQDIYLTAGEYLEFTSSGGSGTQQIGITSHEASYPFAGTR
jgi:hypothetical protein